MLFNTPAFLIFFILVVPLSFLVPRRWQNALLLAASYLFYGFSDPKLILLLLAVTAAAYGCARGIVRRPKQRALWKAIGIGVPVLLLAVFKYAGFLGRLVFASRVPSALETILLPTGISFYTFQAIAYLIDVDRGDTPCETDPLTLALYLSFFPQLVAGPIERAKDLMPQLKAPRAFDPELAIEGCRRMLIGFFEKIAVADILGIYVNRIYGNLSDASGADALLASLLFSIQILCDFKGYTDIARGAANVLGIRLSQNFDRPYRSVSLNEFWQRWHKTLSSWLRDYLYIPLGGNRGGFFRWARNILIVFLISGLWHGADLTFVAWGLAHALLLILERALLRSKTDRFRMLRRILTFLTVNFCWVLFRADSFAEVGLFFSRLFTGWQSVTVSASGTEMICFGAALLGFFTLAFLLPALDGKGRAKRIGRHVFYVCAMYLTAAAYLYLRSGGITSSFIYFRF